MNSFVLKVFFGLLTLRLDLVYGSRILAIFPVPFRDHQVIFRPLVAELSKRGHDLTILTTDPSSFFYENVDSIDLSFAYNLNVMEKLKERSSGLDLIRNVFNVMRSVAEAELKSAQVQQLLRNNSESFDVILVDWSGPTLMNGFAYKFNAPLIGINPGGALLTSHEAMGNPNHPVAFPSILMPFSENLSLMQRMASTIFSFRYRYLYLNEELPQQNEIAKDYFGSDIPDLWDIKSNADLLLINSYQALGNSRPIGPTTIYLGGIHAQQSKQLPRDLQKFMDESYGIVYINLDSVTMQAFAETDRLQKLVNVLESTTNLDIVWNLNELPLVINTTARLYQSPLIPQEDVLAHNNVRLFITTGSQRDIEDAIHHIVPVLGFTFSSSLEHYLLQIEKYSAGIISNYDLDSSLVLLTKIEELANSEKYKENIRHLNHLITDQPMSSKDRAVWWIEYVIRHGGTSHLRNSWNSLSWFQYLLLDVFLTAALIAFVVIATVIIVIVKIKRYSNSLPVELVTRRTKKKLL